MAELENKNDVKDTSTEKKPAKKKNKKPSVFKRIGSFFRSIKSEMKKVVWFSREQTFRSSVVVIVSIVVFGLVISAMDYGFSRGLTALANLF